MATQVWKPWESWGEFSASEQGSKYGDLATWSQSPSQDPYNDYLMWAQDVDPENFSSNKQYINQAFTQDTNNPDFDWAQYYPQETVDPGQKVAPEAPAPTTSFADQLMAQGFAPPGSVQQADGTVITTQGVILYPDGRAVSPNGQVDYWNGQQQGGSGSPAPPRANYEATWDATRGEYVYRPTYVMDSDIEWQGDQALLKLTNSEGEFIGYEPFDYQSDFPGANMDTTGYDMSGLDATLDSITDIASSANLGEQAQAFSSGYDQFTGGLDTLTNQINSMELYDPSQNMDIIGDLSGSLQYGGPGSYDASGNWVSTGDWETMARDSTAESMGYNDWDEMFADMEAMKGKERTDMTGLTDEESAEYDRMIRMNMADMERRATTMAEAALANSGSSIQYMAAAAEANRGMANQQASMQFEKMNQNMAMQLEELRRNDEKYFKMVESGRLGVARYMQARENAVMGAISGYMQQASLGMQADSVEIQAISAQADAIYKGAMTQLGIDSGIMDLTQQWFDTTMAPALTVLQTQLASANLDAMDEATKASIWGSVIEAVGSIGGGFLAGL